MCGGPKADVVCFARTLARGASARTGRLLSENTRSMYVSVVRRFFAFLERQKLLLVNPPAAVTLPARSRLPRAIGEAEVRRLLDSPDAGTALGQRDRAILRAALWHGPEAHGMRGAGSE